MSLRNYRLTKKDGSTNFAASRKGDVWGNDPKITLVEDLGPAPEKKKIIKTPNTKDNVWFGRAPQTVVKFWGLFFKVCIIIAQGDRAKAAERVARLINSIRAAVVVKIIESNDTINPDDLNGDFLSFVDFLTTTNHETDGQPLLSVTWDDDNLPIAERTPTADEVKVLYDNWPTL